MKKYLKLCVLFGMFLFMPMSSFALVEYDEYGDVIQRELGSEEVAITSVGQDASNGEVNITGSNEKTDEGLISIIVSGIAGLTIGCIGAHYIISKK